VKGFNRGGEFDRIESELRSHRPRLDGDVNDSICREVGGRRSRRMHRAGLSLVLTTGVLTAMTAFGGVGYAVDAVQNTLDTSTPATDQYGGTCTEYVNPHGATIPPAGQTSPGTNPNSGENPDGFYQIGSSDGSQVYVIDTATGTQFGPYDSGTVIKYTEANGGDPRTLTIGSTSGEADAVMVHIFGQGDPAVQSVNGGALTVCYVPPPPK
jgi:hypothetical protein